MKLTFLGTGAAEGFPAPWCECDICRHAAENGGREIRRRCAYLLAADFQPGEKFYAPELIIRD